MRTITVEWDLDDGYGGVYPVKATVDVRAEYVDGSVKYRAEVKELDGPVGQDGQELYHLAKQAEEEALEKALDQVEAA